MQTVWLLLFGLVIGTVIIAMGGGGGAFYLGILTAIFQLPPAEAAATSLITAIPSILIGVIGYWREQKIDFHLGNQMLVAALPAVIVGALISPYIPKLLYQWIMGLILIWLGCRIFIKHDQQNNQNSKWAARLYGVMAGLMVGFAGLSGGGPILAGLLILGENLFRATATSAYVLAGMCILGAVLHTTSGQVNWPVGIPLMIGAICGAVLAPRLMDVLSRNPKASKYLQPTIAVLLIVMGAKTILWVIVTYEKAPRGQSRWLLSKQLMNARVTSRCLFTGRLTGGCILRAGTNLYQPPRSLLILAGNCHEFIPVRALARMPTTVKNSHVLVMNGYRPAKFAIVPVACSREWLLASKLISLNKRTSQVNFPGNKRNRLWQS